LLFFSILIRTLFVFFLNKNNNKLVLVLYKIMNKLSLFFCQYEEDDFHADRGINCNREILRTTVCSTCVFDESPTEKIYS
jgi:hypothetical protein